MYDAPSVASGASFANAVRNSGCGRILLPYRLHGAGVEDDGATAAASVGTDGNPVVGVSYSGTTLTVTYADGTAETFSIAGGGGGGTVDQVARDAAEAAQTDADAAGAAAGAASGTANTALGTAASAQADANSAQATADTGVANAGHCADGHRRNTRRIRTRHPVRRCSFHTGPPSVAATYQLDDIWIFGTSTSFALANLQVDWHGLEC